MRHAIEKIKDPDEQALDQIEFAKITRSEEPIQKVHQRLAALKEECESDDENIKSLIELHLRLGNIDEAHSLIKRDKNDPDDQVFAQLEVAKITKRLEDFQKAEELIRRIDDKVCKQICLVEFAYAYLDIGNADQARAIVPKLSSEFDQFGVLLEIAKDTKLRQNLDTVRKFTFNKEEIDSQFVAQIKLILLSKDQQDLSKAETLLNKLKQAEPSKNHHNFDRMLVKVYVAPGKIEEAKALCDKISHPFYRCLAQVTLAVAINDPVDFEKAEQSLNQSDECMHDVARMKFVSGYLRTGHLDKAQEHIRAIKDPQIQFRSCLVYLMFIALAEKEFKGEVREQEGRIDRVCQGLCDERSIQGFQKALRESIQEGVQQAVSYRTSD